MPLFCARNAPSDGFATAKGSKSSAEATCGTVGMASATATAARPGGKSATYQATVTGAKAAIATSKARWKRSRTATT